MTTFVKVHPPEKTITDIDPNRWYPVVAILKDRIDVSPPGVGFVLWEFPKKWVKAVKEDFIGRTE